MYKCNHCKLEIPDNQAEGRIVKVGPKDNPKCYCMECGEPVVYIPDMPQATGGIHGAQATLISNSDNRITTNNYYGSGTPDEQIDTPYGTCRKSEARLCKQCRKWVPLTYFNQEKGVCYDCELKESQESFEEGKSFFDMGFYDDAIQFFKKYESLCPKEKLAEVKTYIGRCYYELKDYKQALKYFVIASRNSPESLYYLGECYYYGYEVDCDKDKAIDIIQNAAQLNCRKAITFFVKTANKAYKGNDYSLAIEMWKRVESVGYEFSIKDCYQIGRSYYYKCDFPTAIVYFERVQKIEVNDNNLKFIKNSAFYLGEIYRKGDGVPKDISKATIWYKKAADLGDEESMYRLGWNIMDELTPEALNLIENSAKKGYRLAQYRMGDIYFRKKDYEKSLKWLLLCVDNKESVIEQIFYDDALEYIAKIYESRGDMPSAMRFYKRLNTLTAFEKLANYYYDDKKEYSEALSFVRILAERYNYANWQNRLGLMYDEGRGVAKDQYEAVKWYRKAAEQGYKWGQYNLALMYYDGTGVSRNFEEAVKWCKKAAEKGHANAQNKLGFMYYTGTGVGKDIEEAKKWYIKAAEQGNENAIRVLKDFNK